MKIGIIADDLTGALDTGVQFSKFGLKSIIQLQPNPENGADVIIINTDSREISNQKAQESVNDAVRNLKGRILFKKIDSTFRGHLETEITTILDQTMYTKAILCPAIIEEDRVVIDSKLWVSGKLLHETPFSHDPTWPAKTSSIEDFFKEPIRKISLNEVRSGPGNLRKKINLSNEKFIVPDSTERQDLSLLADVVWKTNILPCGALAFAKAWIATAGFNELQHSQLPAPLNNPILIVSGSLHPNTIQQVNILSDNHNCIEIVVPRSSSDIPEIQSKIFKELKQANKSIILRTPKEKIKNNKMRETLKRNQAKIAKAIIESFQINSLIGCGGDTVNSLLSELNTEAIICHSEVSPGFPYGILRGGIGNNLPIYTKAGGFGSSQILINLFS